jgi:hypothetical protein
MGQPYPPIVPPPPAIEQRAAGIPAPSAVPSVRRPPASRTIDRFATLALLVIGLLTVLNSAPSFLHFAANLNTFAASYSLGDYSDQALANRIGYALLAANILLYVLTVLWAFRFMARGRIAVYIPMVGFVAYLIIAVVLLSVLGVADPSYFNQLSTQL